MKSTQRIICFALTFASFAAFAQNHDVRPVDKFSKIGNSSSGDVYVKQGSPQRVELVGKKEIVANVETTVSNGKLTIQERSQHWLWSNDSNFKIYVTVEHLDAIEISGSGDLTTQNKLTGTNFDLTLTGSGDVAAEMELSGELNADVAGSGDINLKGKFQSLKSHVRGSGDIDLAAVVTNSAEFAISGSGEIKASGKAPIMEASISGSGNLDARDFETDQCKIRVSGSGDAQIYAKTGLDARTSGSGDISYRGNPVKVSTHNSGSGSVSRIQ